jgi:ribonuclease HI
VSNIIFYNNPTITPALFNPPHLHGLLEGIKGVFADQRRLTFYTDGSLVNLNTEEVSMGIGWTQVEPNTPHQDFSARVTDWPSSARAELLAVLTALYTCPKACTVVICTDSLTTINRYTQLINPLTTNRQKLKIPNHTIWTTILKFIDEAELNLSFVKIKGHSNDINNDKADRLAKEGRSKDILDFNNLVRMNNTVVFKWNDITIEGSLRNHMKMVSQTYVKEKWINGHFTKSLIPIESQCNWTLTWQNIKFFESDLPTSIKQTNKITFIVKNLNLSLPTMEFLKLTQPHIYGNDWYCPKCNHNVPEDWAHVFLCPEQRRFLLNCIDLVQERIIADISEYLIGTVTQATKELLKMNVWTIPTDYPLTSTNDRTINVLDLIRGIVPTSLLRFIRSRTLPTLSLKSIDQLIVKSLSYFIEWIRKDIWIERCDTLKEIQSARGLNRQQLRQKYIHRTNRIQIPQRDTKTHRNTNVGSNTFLGKIDKFVTLGIRPT